MRRYEIERAVKAAALPGPSVAIVMALLTRIWQPEGIIRAEDQPSLNDQSHDTGFHRSTVKRHLNILEKEGWVIRVRPPVTEARRRHARTAYAVTVPLFYPQARSTVNLELGARSAQAWRTADPGMAHTEPRSRRAARPVFRTEEVKKTPQPPPFSALDRTGRYRPEDKQEDF